MFFAPIKHGLIFTAGKKEWKVSLLRNKENGIKQKPKTEDKLTLSKVIWDILIHTKFFKENW